jgi:hypothetical protein
MARALGVSFLGFVALGEDQKPPQRAASWSSLATDAYWCLSRSEGLVWSSRLPFTRFVKQVAFADCRLLWDWRDPLPFIRTAVPGFRR